MSQTQLEKKVSDYLRKSQALEDYWQRPITAEQLQAEMDRMAKHTRQPTVLRELFEALGNDPLVIAECLARPAFVERLIADCAKQQPKPISRGTETLAAMGSYTLPTISYRSPHASMILGQLRPLTTRLRHDPITQQYGLAVK